MNKHYEVIIVGGSAAGLAAAMSLGRALRQVLVIDSGLPCNRQTPHSHNFLTRDGETPANILLKAREELAVYQTVSFLEGTVSAAVKEEALFSIHTSAEETFTASKIIFATGVKNIMPAIPGFAECWGISVIHCPYCHGYEVRDQATGILANGDMAFELARLIFNWTKDITIFTNGPVSISPDQLLRLESHRILIDERPVAAIHHQDGMLSDIAFTDGSIHALNAIYARPAFEQHCKVPEQLGCALTEDGFIKVDELRKTSIPGIYAAGDNTTAMRSIASAVATGSFAGAMLNHELIAEQF